MSKHSLLKVHVWGVSGGAVPLSPAEYQVLVGIGRFQVVRVNTAPLQSWQYWHVIVPTERQLLMQCHGKLGITFGKAW